MTNVDQHLVGESPSHDVQVLADIPIRDYIAEHSTGRAIAHSVFHGEMVVTHPFSAFRFVEIDGEVDARVFTAFDKEGCHLSFRVHGVQGVARCNEKNPTNRSIDSDNRKHWGE